MDGITGDLLGMETAGDALRLTYRLRDDPDTSVRCLDVPPSAAAFLGTKAATLAEAFAWYRGGNFPGGVGFATTVFGSVVTRITLWSDPVPDPDGDG